MRTYENWINDGKKGPVDFAHYNRTGRLNGALQQHIDSIYNGLDEKQKKRQTLRFACEKPQTDQAFPGGQDRQAGRGGHVAHA